MPEEKLSKSEALVILDRLRYCLDDANSEGFVLWNDLYDFISECPDELEVFK